MIFLGEIHQLGKTLNSSYLVNSINLFLTKNFSLCEGKRESFGLG